MNDEIKILENKVKELESHNKILEDELYTKNNDYKKMTMELGQVIFQNEDYEYEIRKLNTQIEQLQREMERLTKENDELKEFKKEVESSTTWKLKSRFK